MTWFWNRETKTPMKKLWIQEAQNHQVLPLFPLRLGASSLLSVVVENRSSNNAQRFRDFPLAVTALCIFTSKIGAFIPNPFISPQLVEDSHKNGTFCIFYSCRDLIFKFLLIFTAKKVANYSKTVRGA